MSCSKFRFEAHVTTAPHFDDLNQKALPFRESVRPILVIDVLIARFLPRRQTAFRSTRNLIYQLSSAVYREIVQVSRKRLSWHHACILLKFQTTDLRNQKVWLLCKQNVGIIHSNKKAIDEQRKQVELIYFINCAQKKIKPRQQWPRLTDENPIWSKHLHSTVLIFRWYGNLMFKI